MAYFLKKTKRKKYTYLQIYESFYNSEKKETAHKCFKSLGNIEKLKADGLDDPIEYYKNEVKKMNEERKQEELGGTAKISDSPDKYIGHFMAKSLLYKFNLERDFGYLQSSRKFDFSTLELLSNMIYARILVPCSKMKSYDEVIPKLFESTSFSRNQMYEAIQFFGSEYKKIVEIFNDRLAKHYGNDTSVTYFDATNFYFEIDKEDDFRRKGPSKENRKCPIVGMGLLLNKSHVPVGVEFYPGNKSEKPIIRNVLQDLKNRNNITGKTIQIADKGLNCAENIYNARKNKDGYIFSKSARQLKDTTRTWVLLDNDYKDVFDYKGNLKYRYKSSVDFHNYSFKNEDGSTTKFRSREKWIVTFNPKLAIKQKREIGKIIDKASNLCLSKAKKSEFGECSKYVDFKSTNEGVVTDDSIAVTINQDKIEKDLQLCGYNLLITSEIEANDEEVYNAYHNLWRIEETFRILKSQLDSRPVYMQTEEGIKGHFLICYLSIFLLRILEIHIFKDEIPHNKIIELMRNLKVINIEKNKYINLTPHNSIIEKIMSKFKLPLDNYFLKDSDIKKMLNFRI